MKKLIIINSVITFLLCFVTHFAYEFFSNPLFSVFFPVNESIWEHMKMIYTTVLLYGIIEYFLLKKYDYHKDNFILTIFTKSIINIPIFLIMYLPIISIFKENMIVTFIILFISILITNIIGFKIYKKPIKYQKIIAIILIIITYIGFTYLTYNPIKNDLFYDQENKIYGIDIKK